MKRILPWVMSVLLAFACVNISQGSALAADNLVVNGSFEEPVAESAYGPLDWKPSLKGWELSEGPAIEIQGGVAGAAYDGKQLVELDGLAVSGIYQDVATEAGKTYKLTFAFSPRPDVAENKLNVSWGDTKLAQLSKSGEGLTDTDWGVYTYYLKATSNSTRLSFDDLDEESDALGTFIDAVSVEPFVCRLPGKDCEVIINPDRTVSIPVKIQIPEDAGTLPLDLMLTQDLTGSYKDDLPVLRKLVPDLVSELRDLQPDTTFGLASFKDKPALPVGRTTDYVYKTELPLTTKTDAFQTTINGFSSSGGKDKPEASLEALLQVAVRANSELGFRKDTRRVAIISTDAPYHKAGDFSKKPANNGDAVLDGNGIGEDYPSVAQVREAVNKANLLPVFLVTNDVKSSYDDLVSKLGVGAVVPLASNSSNLVAALKEALEAVNQNLTLVVLNDEYSYVESVEPDHFENVVPGSEVTTYVNFKYSGTDTGEDVTLRALGLGDLVIDVVVPLDI